MRTQKVIADYLAANGFPWAESTASFIGGTDIKGTPGIVWEVKARANLDPLAWVRQAVKNTRVGELPIVVFRPNGMGENVGSYVAMLRMDDLTELIRAAGYGTPLPGNVRGLASRDMPPETRA